MKVIFMGTPDFAVPCLKKLNERHNVIGVFTQPDKPVGRKQIITSSPVKAYAAENNIDVYQPDSFADGKAFEIIKTLNPDIIVVAAYGKILPSNVLDAPLYGSVNVHASLLPKYRGASPIQTAVINGDTETGVTIMQMNAGLDTGDILCRRKTAIDINETSEELFSRLSVLGSDLLLECLDMIERGSATAVPQSDNGAVYTKKITKALSPIDWNKSAYEIHNLIRGLQSWPCATTSYKGKTIKIHGSLLTDIFGGLPGEIFADKSRIFVSCGDNKKIQITSLQLEGKKKTDTKSFLAGHNFPPGAKFDI